jgi:hypothetical protein
MLVSPIQAIRKTMSYGKRYGVVYSQVDIIDRLISGRIFTKKVLEKEMKEMGIPVKTSKNGYAEGKMKTANNIADLLSSKYENILMIGVTGSVAAGYPKKSDDIDLIIITRRDNLWKTRFALRLFVMITRIPHRRFGLAEKENEFCFNLWLDEDAMLLPKRKRNLKNAMDLILMKPLVNKNSTYEKFVTHNKWVKRFVANGYLLISQNKVNKEHLEKNIEQNITDKAVNFLLFWPQFLYMRAKIGGGLIDLKRAFFHPNTNK